MLENIVYYLQEKVAPEGYELDTRVYIICDNEDTYQQAQEMLKDTAVLEKNEEGKPGGCASCAPAR